MRVVSLVPAATEMIAAMDAADLLVGISHECDWPPDVQHLPRVTTTPIDSSLPSGEIDTQVREAGRDGRPVVAVERARLVELAPDLIITQDLCDVCAVADGQVFTLANAMERAPRVWAMKGRTLDGVLDDLAALGAAIGRAAAGLALGNRLRAGLRALPQPPRPAPKVVCIEWLDPIFLAGHWVPDLIAAAGGVDVGAEAGSHSRVVSWEELERLDADVVIVAPCGFGLERAEQEFRAFEDRLREQGKRPLSERTARLILLDGNAYTSRPGPRLLDAAERIAAGLSGRTLDGMVLWGASPSPLRG